ncbi:serine/threonine-protein kinase [Micromonospora sp. WMMD1120]|uniref:protein kinase domain-containing protein n=1 Tax=Micromonospora sp. WMMD1120 TaxID=3016106 RepID=UPI002416CD27|nr:FHA domain-containing serine/threonine-protein kinase [Micromonospora sp. WMMD1120]MDG4805587.1 serine/threonine-protein kinase [Micromonospora sp. WMMD1120]
MPASPTVTVVVRLGSHTESYAFDRRARIVVGRAPDCGIHVDDGRRRISRHHCLLDVDPPTVRVRDLDSRNGTLVNGRRIDDEHELFPADQVHVGGAVLRVTVEHPHPPEATRPDPDRALPALRAAVADGAPGLREFADHQVLDEIGRGGHGVVYLARHRPTGELVALKTLLADHVVDPSARDIFLREIACTRQLRHQNVVALRHAGAAGEAFYFTCEYCPDGNVAQLVARRGGRLAVDEAVPIVLDALDGLAHAHRAELPVVLADGRTALAHGLVHRDVTPQNLLLAAGPVTKVADFGLAKAFDQAGLSGHTRTGATGGSVGFQSRAQLVDYKYARPEVDLWAVTACLYWMLTGATPRDFPPGADPIAVVLRTSVVPVRHRLGSVPRRLANVIDEMLVDNPRVPEATATELADALRQAL